MFRNCHLDMLRPRSLFPLRWRQSRNPAWQQHRNRLAPTPERGFLLAFQHSRVSTRKPWSLSFLSVLSSLSWVSPLPLSSPLSLLLPSLSLSHNCHCHLFLSVSSVFHCCNFSSLLFITFIIIVVVVVVVVVNSDVASSWSLPFVLFLLAHILSVANCQATKLLSKQSLQAASFPSKEQAQAVYQPKVVARPMDDLRSVTDQTFQ